MIDILQQQLISSFYWKSIAVIILYMFVIVIAFAKILWWALSVSPQSYDSIQIPKLPFHVRLLNEINWDAEKAVGTWFFHAANSEQTHSIYFYFISFVPVMEFSVPFYFPKTFVENKRILTTFTLRFLGSILKIAESILCLSFSRLRSSATMPDIRAHFRAAHLIRLRLHMKSSKRFECEQYIVPSTCTIRIVLNRCFHLVRVKEWFCCMYPASVHDRCFTCHSVKGACIHTFLFCRTGQTCLT